MGPFELTLVGVMGGITGGFIVLMAGKLFDTLNKEDKKPMIIRNKPPKHGSEVFNRSDEIIAEEEWKKSRNA